jgi:hypothetical protein
LSGQRSDITPGITIYDDSLRGFNDWSWATRDLTNESPVRTGSSSIRVLLNAYSAVRLHNFTPFSVAGLGSLEFWIHGGPTGGQNANVILRNGATVVGQQTLAAALGGPVPANAWTKVVMPFSAMGVTAGATIDEFSFEDSTGINQPVAYLDDIRLVPGGVSTATTGVPTTAGPTTPTTPTSSTTAVPTTVVPSTTLPTNPTVAGKEVFLFDDAFRNGYQNFSSAVTDPAAKSPVKRGTRSIKVTPSNRLSFSVRGPATDGSRYANLRLWVYSKGSGGQRVDVVSYSATQAERGRISINSLLGGPLPGGVWRELVIPMSALNAASGPVGGFAIQDTSGTNQAAIWIDDLRLVEQASNGTATTTAVPVSSVVSPTTAPSTTAPSTTAPSTTAPSTIPGPTTTIAVQAANLTLLTPNTATAGVAFPMSVTGAIGGGRVDFVVDGKAVGSVSVDAAGKASIVGTAWVPGVVKVEAVWVTFVAGVPTEKAVSALVTVS